MEYNAGLKKRNRLQKNHRVCSTVLYKMYHFYFNENAPAQIATRYTFINLIMVKSLPKCLNGISRYKAEAANHNENFFSSFECFLRHEMAAEMAY